MQLCVSSEWWFAGAILLFRSSQRGGVVSAPKCHRAQATSSLTHFVEQHCYIIEYHRVFGPLKQPDTGLPEEEVTHKRSRYNRCGHELAIEGNKVNLINVQLSVWLPGCLPACPSAWLTHLKENNIRPHSQLFSGGEFYFLISSESISPSFTATQR